MRSILHWTCIIIRRSRSKSSRIGKALVNAVEERARAENFITIIVSGAPDYFEQLGCEKAEIYDIYSDESTLEQLQVKFYGIN